jgi:hypothetical protein
MARQRLTPTERARRALAANKARLDAAHSSGLASDKTLRSRGYDADPQGGMKVPEQKSPSEIVEKRRCKRKRRT